MPDPHLLSALGSLTTLKPASRLRKHRKLIVAVIAAIGLVLAFIVIEGLSFGIYSCIGPDCFGGYRVAATSVTCAVVNDTCAVVLTNTGTDNTWVNGCYFVVGSQSVPGTLFERNAAPSSTVEVRAGGSTSISCVISESQTSGVLALGYLELTNGPPVPYSSTWQ